MEGARTIKRQLSPKLGGVTRWVRDKFLSIKFLMTEMGSIREFVRQEIIRQKTKASASLMLLGDLLANNDIQLIMQEAARFLEELKPLHVLLDLYSDPKCVPLACGVWDSLEKIRVWAESKASTIPKAKEAYDKHMARVKERHNMLFWECVRWLNPNVIEYRYDEEILSLDKMNRAFHPEVIPKDEWDKYTQITSFNVPEGMHVGQCKAPAARTCDRRGRVR